MPDLARPLLVVAALLAPCRAGAGPTDDGRDARDDRVERWREDVRHLASELPKLHKNLFHDLPREEFDAAIDDLEQRLPDLEDREIEAEIARVVASVGDSHTGVDWGSPPFVRDPSGAPSVELMWFADGMHVIAASSDQSQAVGARVVKIDGIPFDEAWRRAAAVISHENEPCLHALAPTWLAQPRFLHALGLADSDSSAQLT